MGFMVQFESALVGQSNLDRLRHNSMKIGRIGAIQSPYEDLKEKYVDRWLRPNQAWWFLGMLMVDRISV